MLSFDRISVGRSLIGILTAQHFSYHSSRVFSYPTNTFHPMFSSSAVFPSGETSYLCSLFIADFSHLRFRSCLSTVSGLHCREPSVLLHRPLSPYVFYGETFWLLKTHLCNCCIITWCSSGLYRNWTDNYTNHAVHNCMITFMRTEDAASKSIYLLY